MLWILLLLAQDAVEVKTNDGAATPQVRLSVTSGATTADVWIRRSRLKFDTAVGSEGYLNVSTSAPGTPAAGDLRYSGGALLFHDGSSWLTVGTTTGSNAAVLLAPSSAQTWTAANSGIFLNETGAGTPALLQLQSGGVDRFVVSNTGAVSSATWNGATIAMAYGGTGLTSSGSSGNFLRSNGTNWTSSAIQASDLPSGSGNYIQNQTAAQQSAGFWISGTARVDGNSGFGGASSASYRMYVQSLNTQQGMLVAHDVASGNVVFGVGFGTTNKFTVNGVGQVSLAIAHSGGDHLTIRGGSTMIVQDSQLLFADGLVGTPAYGFINDTNTGMYRIGVDNLGFSTAGVGRMNIDSSGRINVSTTNLVSYGTLLTATGGITSGDNVLEISIPTGSGNGGNGVWAEVTGTSAWGIYGAQADTGVYGILGYHDTVPGYVGVYGYDAGNTTYWAGYFSGKVESTSTLTGTQLLDRDNTAYYADPSSTSTSWRSAGGLWLDADTTRTTTNGGPSRPTLVRDYVSTTTTAGTVVAQTANWQLERNAANGTFTLRSISGLSTAYWYRTGATYAEGGNPGNGVGITIDPGAGLNVEVWFGYPFGAGEWCHAVLTRSSGDYYWTGYIVTNGSTP